MHAWPPEGHSHTGQGLSLGSVWMVMDAESVEVSEGTPVAWRGEKQRTSGRQQDVGWQEGAGAAGPEERREGVPGRRRCGCRDLLWVGLCLPKR